MPSRVDCGSGCARIRNMPRNILPWKLFSGLARLPVIG